MTDPGMSLTKPEAEVLKALAGEWDFGSPYLLTFSELRKRTRLKRRSVVTATRRLVRKGYAEREAAFNEHTGMLCGSGFEITPAGTSLARTLAGKES